MLNKKLLLYAGLFSALTLAGVLWAINCSHVQMQLLHSLVSLAPNPLIWLILLLLALYITDIWRYQVLGLAVGQPISFIIALETSIANDFFSWITPGAAMGAPAAIYVLHTRKVPWESATLICFGKSMLGTALILMFTFISIFLGYGPSMHPAFMGLLLYSTGIVSTILIIPVLATIKKDVSLACLNKAIENIQASRYWQDSKMSLYLTRLIHITINTIKRLYLLRARGPCWALAVILIHIPYLIIYGGILWLLLWHFGVPFSVKSAAISSVYIGFMYIAPTPGAAGLSEASADAFLGTILTPQAAFSVIMLFRVFTVYFHLLVGIIYLTFNAIANKILVENNA